jgi:hypothetical protein
VSAVAVLDDNLDLRREEADLIDPVIRAWMHEGVTWGQIRALRSADLEMSESGMTVICRFVMGCVQGVASKLAHRAVELSTDLSARLMVWMVENGNIGTPERRVFEKRSIA